MNTSNQYVKYWFEVIQNWQDPANNISNVTVRVWAKRTNSGYTTSGDGSVFLRVEQGTTSVYSNTKSSYISITSSSRVYHEWTGNIKHNADGGQYVQAFATINISGGILSSSEQGYQMGLTTIPRTSSFTLNKSSCELGTSFTVSISRASSSFTHAVTYTIGSAKRYMQKYNGTATSVSYTPPVSDSTFITNSTKGTVTIGVETYSGGTLIGSTSKKMTVTVPSSVKPTLNTLSIARVDNGVPSSWGVYVKGKSKAKVSFSTSNETIAHGSAIKKRSVSGGGYSSSTATLNTGILNKSGTITFTGKITDGRGREGVKTNSITVIDYHNPSIDNVLAERCFSTGVSSEDGTYVKIVPKFSFASVSGKNSITANVKYRQNGVTAWTDAGSLVNNTEKIIGGGNISVDKQYEVLITVTDGLNSSSSKTINISTAFVTMDFKKGGKGVAIGKVSETDNLFDVNMPTRIRAKLNLDGTLDTNGEIITRNKPITAINTYGMNTRNPNGNHYARIESSTTANEAVFGVAGSTTSSILSPYLRIGTTKDSNGNYKFQFNGANVVSRFENSNGKTIRFYDGTQICTKELYWNTPINKVWGNLFSSGYVELGAWSSPFLAGTTIDIFPAVTTLDSSAIAGGVKKAGLVDAGLVELYRGSSADLLSQVYVKIFVIGRWK